MRQSCASDVPPIEARISRAFIADGSVACELLRTSGGNPAAGERESSSDGHGLASSGLTTAAPRASDANPPRWAECVLRLFLTRRNRDTITGDLLEEYREVILPTRGRFRAQLWHVQQTLSLVDSVTFGIALGTLLGTWILVGTAISPLAEDTALGVGEMFGGVFLLLGIVRVNLFLDAIRYRSDWQNLVSDFRQSGFGSLRAYSNYVYARQIVIMPVVGTVAGVISGAMGGLLGGLGRRQAS